MGTIVSKNNKRVILLLASALLFYFGANIAFAGAHTDSPGTFMIGLALVVYGTHWFFNQL